MKINYNSGLKANLTADAEGVVRHIRHTDEFFESEENVPGLSAESYLHAVSDVYKIPKEQLTGLHKQVSFTEPVESQGVEFRLSEEKQLFDTTVVGYYQTFHNVPIWRKGLTVNIKQGPNRVVGSTNNSAYDVKGKLPGPAVIDKYKRAFALIRLQNAVEKIGMPIPQAQAESEEASFMADHVKMGEPMKASSKKSNAAQATSGTRYTSGKFFFYRYGRAKRYAGKPTPKQTHTHAAETERDTIPFPFLPDVPEAIQEGTYYLVAEFILTMPVAGYGNLPWLILVETVSGAVLYIMPLASGVNGLVFHRDPVTVTGDLTVTPASGNAVLNMHRSSQPLTNLDAPVMGTQNLSGTYVSLQELSLPNVAAPTQTAGSDFNYDARTNDFAGVSTYYHLTELFKTIEGLGFSKASYFGGTTFPIPVDHRALGNNINGQCNPDAMGDGIGNVLFALCDLTDTTNPLGRAVDKYVHWHEVGGHGILYDHVSSPNLNFSHSAGDGLAAIQMDPQSALRDTPRRFRYAPFLPLDPSIERFFNRSDPEWMWGGAEDDTQYGSEQILATCHFRMYQSMGGDSADVNRRLFASRMATYLILKTVGQLTPATNPNDAELWCNEMMVADQGDWTTEGLSGGAYNKLVRWTFEKQGSFGGQPPLVDVYINDGRNGEYGYQAVHWENISQWNRNTNDGLPGHEPAILGTTNYMYVKIKNRGTSTATNVRVKGYHCLPGAGLTWPTDFTEMGPAGGIAASDIDPNNAEEITVGPFAWVPNVNALGHDCTLMIVSATGDPSNIDNFTAGDSIQEWRLVPHDNNIGQRNVVLVSGESESGIMNSMEGAVFYAGNSFNRRAGMEMKIRLPELLEKKGWTIKLDGVPSEKFTLKSGEKRRIGIRLVPGAPFTADEIRNTANRDITVSLYGNDSLLGGMTYRVDPDLKATTPKGPDTGKACTDKAGELLECLKLGGGKVKKVHVKKVSLDIELDNDCNC